MQKIRLIKDFETTEWSGGETTELFIYPYDANYKDRDFSFRISTASVRLEESSFTPLPGVARQLMILDGAITIHHKNHYSKRLKPFELDNFEGDWATSAKGQCTDFNIMTTGKTRSELKALLIEKGKSIDYQVSKESSWLLFYAFSGIVNLKINQESILLETGQILALEEFSVDQIQIEALENAQIIISKIFL